jgi:hypothetical protein
MTLVCGHTPRANFVYFKQDSVIGNDCEVDGLAMCNRCFILPVEEVKFVAVIQKGS